MGDVICINVLPHQLYQNWKSAFCHRFYIFGMWGCWEVPSDLMKSCRLHTLVGWGMCLGVWRETKLHWRDGCGWKDKKGGRELMFVVALGIRVNLHWGSISYRIDIANI